MKYPHWHQKAFLGFLFFQCFIIFGDVPVGRVLVLAGEPQLQIRNRETFIPLQENDVLFSDTLVLFFPGSSITLELYGIRCELSATKSPGILIKARGEEVILEETMRVTLAQVEEQLRRRGLLEQKKEAKAGENLLAAVLDSLTSKEENQSYSVMEKEPESPRGSGFMGIDAEYLDQGINNLINEQFHLALSCFLTIKESGPETVYPLKLDFLIAVCYVETGEYARAMAALDSAMNYIKENKIVNSQYEPYILLYSGIAARQLGYAYEKRGDDYLSRLKEEYKDHSLIKIMEIY